MSFLCTDADLVFMWQTVLCTSRWDKCTEFAVSALQGAAYFFYLSLTQSSKKF